MPAQRPPSRRDKYYATGFILFVVGFLLAVGTGLLPVSIGAIIKDPVSRRFVEIVLLRILPLWIVVVIAFIFVLAMLSRRFAVEAWFTKRRLRILGYANVSLLLLVTVAFEYFSFYAPDAISTYWFWQVIIGVFLGVVALLLTLVRREWRRRAEAEQPGP